MTRSEEFVDRYVALWNEPDEQVRARTVRALWRDDGGQVVAAPQEMRAAASALGFPNLAMEVRGYEELEFRVAAAYREFVAPGTYRFQRRGDVARVGGALKFGWEMVAVADGTAVGSGTDVMLVDHEHRIVTDYQFVD